MLKSTMSIINVPRRELIESAKIIKSSATEEGANWEASKPALPDYE